MKRRKFTKEFKLQVLAEAQKNGTTATINKHGLYPATFYSWRTKLSEMGENGLNHGYSKAKLKEIKNLEKENQGLKEIVAEKELKIRMLEEVLKKNRPLWEKKSK